MIRPLLITLGALLISAAVVISQRGSDSVTHSDSIGEQIERAPPPSGDVAPLGNRTFDQAYDQAQPGDVIEVPAGHYPNQSITGTKSGRVTLRAAGQVDVGEMQVDADNLTLRGIDARSLTVSSSAPDNPIEDVRVEDAATRRMYIENTRRLTVTDSEFGPNPGIILVQVGAWPETHDLTFERVHMFDNPPKSPEDHLECLFTTGVQGLTVRDSRFERCGYFGILNGLCCGAMREPSRFVLEGNTFGRNYRWDNGPKLTAPYSVILSRPVTGPSRVVGNHFSAPPAVETSWSQLEACGNTGQGLNTGRAADWDQPC
jgi:hypothetical protein